MTYDQVDFWVRQGDTLTAIEAALTDRNGPVDLTEARSVEFHMKPSGIWNDAVETLDATADFVDREAGTVRYAWADGDTDHAGDYNAEWEVTFNDGTIATFPNYGNLHIRVTAQLA